MTTRGGGTWRETLGAVSTFSVLERGQTLGKHWERLADFEIVGRWSKTEELKSTISCLIEQPRSCWHTATEQTWIYLKTMTFEPPWERWKKQKVVKVTPVTSSLQAVNESGGTIISIQISVHKNCTGTLFRSGRHRCGVCVCAYKYLHARTYVCDRGSEGVSLQM